MPIFGNGIDIIVGSSGSSSTSSFNGINFIYTNPDYGFGATSSSLGSLSFSNLNEGINGASGEFIIKLPSPENADTTGAPSLKLRNTGSLNSPIMSLGVPQNNPSLGTFDLRANKNASEGSPSSIVLRTNEDGVIEIGETTGKISFAIESGSAFGGDPSGRVPEEFLASASTADIFSRVISSDPKLGVVGSLVFQVNDNDSRTEPFDIMEMGYGIIPLHETSLGVLVSASIEIANSGAFFLINDENGFDLVEMGHDSSKVLSSGRLQINSVNVSSSLLSNIELHSIDNSFISNSSNFGIGTSTPTSKLEVIGNLAVSTDITASNISSSNNVFVRNKVGRTTSNTFIDFDPGTGDIETVINGSTLLTLTETNVSSSGLLHASGAILSPTSSGVPSFTGVDGQMVPGSDGSNHYIYVWMSGGWKSSSLS